MGMDTLAGAAHDDMKDAVMTGWEYRHDDDIQRQSYEYSRSLNSQMAGLSAEARRSSASDMVAGYRAAGLNPAAAAGTSFGSVSAGGSVGGSASPAYHSNSGLGKLALEEQKYRDSERDLMAAQAENLRADAAEKRSRMPGNNWNAKNAETQFKRSQAEDASIAATMENFYIEITQMGDDAHPVDKAIASAVESLSNDEKLNAGTIKGLQSYLDYYGFNYETLADNAENSVRAYFNKILMDDKKYTQAQADRILNENSKIVKDIAYLGSMMALAASESSLNEDQKKLIARQIQKLNADIQNMHHNDVVWLAKNDKKGLAVKSAYDAANAAAAGIGFGLGAGTGGAAGKAVGGAVFGKKDAQPPAPTQRHQKRTTRNYNKKGEETGSTVMEQLSW